MPLSPGQLTEAQALWSEGHSTRVIGERIGVTKNVIIGMSRRHRDLFPPRVIEKPVASTAVVPPIQMTALQLVQWAAARGCRPELNSCNIVARRIGHPPIELIHSP